MTPSTPPTTSKRREYDTITRTRFFDAFDSREEGVGVGTITRLPEIEIPPSTGRLWLKQREQIGSQASRRTRRRSSRLGRKPIVSASILDTITNQEDPIHEKSYEEQVEELELECKPRTLQHHAAQAGARRFKKGYTSEISATNKQNRVNYGRLHKNKTLTGFWEDVWFTDEVHLLSASLQNKAEYELRFPGQENRKAHLREVKSSGLKVTVHIAAGISYNHKGPLIFYKDPKEPSEKVYKPRKPRKTKYQTDSEYEAQVQEWERNQPEGEVIPKGNAMSQAFYAKEVLPIHIQEIQRLQKRYNRKIRLQEDGDPSHGNKSMDNPCARLKRDADLYILVHPAQSPDLNPIEAIWMIIKQRLRGGNWETVAEFKAAIQREWDRITLDQIRKRIREMPWRCKRVIELEGARVRSSVW